MKRTIRQTLLAWALLGVGLIATVLTSQNIKHDIEEDGLRQFSFTCDQISLKIRERLGAYALTLRGGVALFDASEVVTRQEWRAFTKTLRAQDSIPGVQGIGFAQVITPEQLASHIARIRSEGFPEYSVYPPGQRAVYTSIVYLEPFRDRNLRAFGFDMFSEPVRRAAMEQARDTGEATLSGKVELVQETGTEVQAGTLMYVPVYRSNTAHDTIEQRQSALIGWIYSPYRMNDLMAGILGDWEQREGQTISLRIYDGPEPTPAALLFASKTMPASDKQTLLQQQRIIDFNGQQWLLAFDRVGTTFGIGYASVWAALMAGLALSGLLFGLMRSVTNTQANAARIARNLTKEIRRREQLLTVSEYRWRFALEGSGDGVWDWNLADDTVFFSKRCKEMLGFAEDETGDSLGKWDMCLHPDDKTQTLQSVQAYLDGKTPLYICEHRVICKDGSYKWMLDRGMVVSRSVDDKPLRMIGTYSDITERKHAELLLRTAHAETQRFKDALDYVSSCIYMKDTQSRYVYANRTTLELFGCSAEDVIGCDDSRFFPPDTVKWLREIDARVFMGEQTKEEVEVAHEDGSRRVYLEIKTPIYENAGNKTIWGLLGISTDITVLKAHEQYLENIAHNDALTGLPNRVLLADRMHQAMAQTLRRGKQMAVAYIDLDGFKAINDSHGHDAGDHLLMTVATNMKRVLREGDTLARLGGDEFVAVLLDLSDADANAPMLVRLLHAAAEPVHFGPLVLQVSASVGVTYYPQPEDVDADQLLRQSDQAMYQAKLAGKNNFHIFDIGQDRLARGHHESLERIRRALAEKEFVLYYHPKVNLREGTVIGVEALIRWQHPDRGLLLPAAFLPVIEDHPLAVELGEWVIDTALTQLERWKEAGLDISASVNVGARQLQQLDFVERLKALLAVHPSIKPTAFELEVLETSALADLAQVSRVMEGCRDIGVRFALDDFGTGYSSLTYLKRLSADILKIDQSFVHDMLDNPEDLAILEGVLGLASAFRRQTIAEGVETVEHGEMLLQLGCYLAQGHGIAHPMPAEQLVEWAAAWKPDPRWIGLKTLSRADLPLLYAGVELRAWVRAFEASLVDEQNAPPPLNCHQCHFGEWLDGGGLTGRGSQPVLQAIETLHRRVHDLAAEISGLKTLGRNEELQAKLDEFHGLKDALLEYLKGLQNDCQC